MEDGTYLLLGYLLPTRSRRESILQSRHMHVSPDDVLYKRVIYARHWPYFLR